MFLQEAANTEVLQEFMLENIDKKEEHGTVYGTFLVKLLYPVWTLINAKQATILAVPNYEEWKRQVLQLTSCVCFKHNR